MPRSLASITYLLVEVEDVEDDVEVFLEFVEGYLCAQYMRAQFPGKILHTTSLAVDRWSTMLHARAGGWPYPQFIDLIAGVWLFVGRAVGASHLRDG